MIHLNAPTPSFSARGIEKGIERMARRTAIETRAFYLLMVSVFGGGGMLLALALYSLS
jgi:hypothetical protein